MPTVHESNFDDKVRPHYTEITHWIRMGTTERQVAVTLGVSLTSWNSYKRNYPELALVVSDARKQMSCRVEKALFQRAVGYDYTELRTVTDNEGKEVLTTTTKHVPPDVLAAIFWLKNRETIHWKDRREASQDNNAPSTLADVVRSRRDRLLENNN